MELFHISFLKFELLDLIDVVIVAFLLYRVLLLMKGTRSVQIVVGLFLLFLISFFAFWFQLEGMKWLITNIATVGILVLVIVFQPEIRGALAQIGHNKLFRVFFIAGLIFIILGIIIGFRLQTTTSINIDLYETIDWLTSANSQHFIEYKIPGMPDFLIRSRISNMFYLLGWALFIIAVSIYYIDIKGKRNNFITMLISS